MEFTWQCCGLHERSSATLAAHDRCLNPLTFGDDKKSNFSPEFIEELITKNNSTFVEYTRNTEGWKVEWLKTKLVGNDYNDNLCRVKIIQDEGKGANNRLGIVQDLYLIDGEWKIVLWNHYPKS